MTIKIFADGANLEDIIRLNEDPRISGMTTNPTLLKKAGIVDYKEFAKEVLKHVKEKPVSFEVIADTEIEMVRQASSLASLADNVFVKIPITNTKGMSTSRVINELSRNKIKLNVTAIFTHNQVQEVSNIICDFTPAIISVFAGRIADTQVDPVPLMKLYKKIISPWKNQELLWASPREILNLKQAEECGCDIITMTPDLIAKMDLKNKDLTEYSLDTVQMFYGDAQKAGYIL
jgi:transaldolase